MRHSASPRLVVRRIQAQPIAFGPKDSGSCAGRSKRQLKGPKYAKSADVGHWVHAKGIHVTSEAQLKHWFGSKAKSKYFSGIVKERFLSDGTGRKDWFYKVQYDLPDGQTSTVSNKAIFHFPDKWVDPDPPPEAVAHGTISKTIRPKVLLAAINNQPPSIINIQERNDDDDTVSAMQYSHLTDDSAMSTVVKPVVKNGMDWFLVKEIEDVDINGTVHEVAWRFLGNNGTYMEPGDDPGGERTILDYFLTVMPQYTIRRILKETNDKLSQRNQEILTHGELLRFFGVCILITRYDFDNRSDLWSMATGSKYMAPANLAATGMTCHRFEKIFECLTFSIQLLIR
jgi:hypothetical protein